MRVTRPVLGRSPMPKKAVRTSSWRRLELVQLCAFACNRPLPLRTQLLANAPCMSYVRSHIPMLPHRRRRCPLSFKSR